MRFSRVALPLLLLTACAGPTPFERTDIGDVGHGVRGSGVSGVGGSVIECLAFYDEVDRQIAAAGVRDAEAVRIEGLPYLRADRFLASFKAGDPRDVDNRNKVGDPQEAGEPSEAGDLEPVAFEAWVDRMAARDLEGRRVEYLNLSNVQRERLDRLAEERLAAANAKAAFASCGEDLRAHDLATDEQKEALGRAIAVPDNYSNAKRIAGLYPLTAIGVAFGYERWKATHLATFEQPLAAMPFSGTATSYRPAEDEAAAPLDPAEVTRLLETSRDSLGAYDIEPEALARLGATFAPTLLIDRVSAADDIGRPIWSEDGLPTVDADDPVLFLRLAHGWFEGQVVPQLVYQFWFEARPVSGPFDLLGGRLDGLIWRVTLDPKGHVLVQDTIHSCGCYHLFFPSKGVQRKPQPEDAASDVRETFEVPAAAPPATPQERLRVRIDAASHYIMGLDLEPNTGADVTRSYRLAIDGEVPDFELRTIAFGQGGAMADERAPARRSLYGEDGLIDGTERAERWLLWPMGIASPGAMRQWGHHATAFVGRRHFDDPWLIDNGFSR